VTRLRLSRTRAAILAGLTGLAALWQAYELAGGVDAPTVGYVVVFAVMTAALGYHALAGRDPDGRL
jgi:4-hydroxybenzoate polyprenyltransferase